MNKWHVAAMNWQLAIEKNHGALRRILAMLVALVGMTGGGEAGSDRQKTLPRHLHRFVLRLLRPAEAATRRLIIVAAHGLVVKLPKPRSPKPRPEPPTIFVLDCVNGSIVSVPVVLPKPANTLVRPKSVSLSLLDPMKRFDVRRKFVKSAAMPSIRLLGIDDNPLVQFFRRPEPLPPPAPPLPSPDDPLDARRIHRRLDAIGSALDDLPGQAQRMARWQARRDARLARERASDSEPSPSRPFTPPSVLPDISPSRGEISSGSLGDTLISPLEGEMSGRTEGGQRGAPYAENAAQPRRRFQRFEPMRPGRPPGWRRKPNHDVYEVLNELHGLAVWVRDRPDTS